MQEHLNNEFHRIDRTRRDRRRSAAWLETKKLALFALVWAIVLGAADEVLRIFWQADALHDALPLCLFFLTLGCAIGRSGLREELRKEGLL